MLAFAWAMTSWCGSKWVQVLRAIARRGRSLMCLSSQLDVSQLTQSDNEIVSGLDDLPEGGHPFWNQHCVGLKEPLLAVPSTGKRW